MKRTILTSIAAIAMAIPAIAANIPNDATCNSGVLGVSSGSANLEADYTANTINITWDGNGGSTPTGGASSCTYDKTFNLPTAPSRAGYTFAGWVVNNPSCFASLGNKISSSFDADKNTWSITYSGGTINGISKESSFNEESHSCSCKPTSVVKNGSVCSDMSTTQSVSSNDGEAVPSSKSCAESCATDIQDRDFFKMTGLAVNDCSSIRNRETCASSGIDMGDNTLDECSWFDGLGCQNPGFVPECNYWKTESSCTAAQDPEDSNGNCSWQNGSCTPPINTCPLITAEDQCWASDCSWNYDDNVCE